MIMTLDQSRIDALRDERAPLYCRYHGQTRPQGAYIELDEDGRVDANYDAEIGGAVPMAVWHGRTRRYSVTPYLSGSALVELVDEISPLLERVHDGLSEEWDGSNHVGTLTADARSADEAIRDRLESVERDIDVVVDIDGWVADVDVAADATDDDLRRLAAEIDEQAWRECRAIIDGDVVEALRERRDTVHCDCGEWLGEACGWTGPREETVLVRFVPEQYRSAHVAAGYSGIQPDWGVTAGVQTIRVERSCADHMVEQDGDWVEIISSPEDDGDWVEIMYGLDVPALDRDGGRS
jgi:hypothetical protein